MERPYEIVFKESSRILKNGASMIVFMSILRVETLVEIANEFGTKQIQCLEIWIYILLIQMSAGYILLIKQKQEHSIIKEIR